MIDFHAHILPCADHGSDSVSTSLKQISLAKKAGISTIIATPHFYMNSYSLDKFVERREKSYNLLTDAMKECGFNIDIFKASEVSLQVDLFKLEDLKPLCVEKTNFMLVEMPMNVNWTNWHYDAIDELIARGIEPIIAHINRYSSFYLEKLFEKDILFQVNVEAFKSLSSKLRILNFYKKGYVNLLGSDIHSFSMDTYDTFKKYCEKYPKMFETSNINAIKILNSRKNGN